MAEFDEDIPWDEREAELKQTRDQETSRLETELTMLEKEVWVRLVETLSPLQFMLMNVTQENKWKFNNPVMTRYHINIYAV